MNSAIYVQECYAKYNRMDYVLGIVARPNSTSEEGAVTTETLGESGKSPKSFIVNLVTKQLFSNAQVQLSK